ncbi:crossover junction endodeoxyribonuclease RuvC [Magnetofaba australis]|uniref:Putative bacteriophage-like protein n=1 Tax=Magnetofaba australis IT-1 TaxID=1434232 RepID=A0A1Y2K734_9PROT|nr:crossover junction endodeoxyribonuclease RuvC [Magnetofaba australis]OSM04162.1 putative bacteriophage-like protein [Magnetofaba australis IT-1]
MTNQNLPAEGWNEKRVLLALDLGSQTGWAVRHPDGNITSGTLAFKNNRFEGGGMRYLRFRQWLDELNALVGGVGAVAVEEVRRHAGVDAAHVYGGFLAVVTSWCEARGIPYQGVPVGTIKKHATGKGNASKAQVIHAMKRLGFKPEDDNQADALALLHWAIAQEVGL